MTWVTWVSCALLIAGSLIMFFMYGDGDDINKRNEEV